MLNTHLCLMITNTVDLQIATEFTVERWRIKRWIKGHSSKVTFIIRGWEDCPRLLLHCRVIFIQEFYQPCFRAMWYLNKIMEFKSPHSSISNILLLIGNNHSNAPSEIQDLIILFLSLNVSLSFTHHQPSPARHTHGYLTDLYTFLPVVFFVFYFLLIKKNKSIF